jgi:hypothetical protein
MIKSILTISTFVLLTQLSNAELIYNNASDVNSLSKKNKQLIKECVDFYKVKSFESYSIRTPPENYSNKSIERLDMAKWKNDYGADTNLVITLFISSKNRFNETTNTEVLCRFIGNDFILTDSYDPLTNALKKLQN